MDQSERPAKLTVPSMDKILLTTTQGIAARHALDSSLVCAVIEQESAWNTHAIRYEPAFFAKYVAPVFTNNRVQPPTNTEACSRAISWGLMQVMGQSAREAGFTGQFLSELCDPAAGIEVGCQVFSQRLRIADGSELLALQLWNGGSNPKYAMEVEARRPKYLIDPS
jgi:soluble lytic murein transglycosylase-like protein